MNGVETLSTKILADHFISNHSRVNFSGRTIRKGLHWERKKRKDLLVQD
jgi:hypothetical protein